MAGRGRGKEGKMSSISEVQPQIRKKGSEREKDRQTERLRQRESNLPHSSNNFG